MKAATRYRYGKNSIISISELAKPIPQSSEILIRVKATTVNRTDMAVYSGFPIIMRLFTGIFTPNKKILGTDFAGVVESIGNDVVNFEVGDHVFGFYDQGLESQAEYVCISEKGNVIQMPDGISFENAAASCEAAHYAYNFIKNIEFKPSDRILVNGGTGAIGSAMIQMLKAKNLKVTAVCHKDYFERVYSLGADVCIDYSTVDFTKGKEIYDYVFDAVGKSTFGKCKQILSENGIYLSSELGPYLQNVFLPIMTKLRKGRKVIFPLPTDIMDSLNFIKELTEQNKFKPLIDQIIELEKIAEAYTYVSKGMKIGNVIIKI